MSLKAFHVVFVVLSTLLCAGFGVWEIRAYYQSSDKVELLLGVGSLLFGAAMVWYGLWFLRKLKGVSYL
jgi:hypothetical protein